MSKKKVLFVIESFVLGGAEKVLIDIVNNLSPERFDVTVCSIFKRSVYPTCPAITDNPFLPHVHFRWLVNNEYRLLYVIFNFFVNRIPSFLYRLLIGDNYDVVVAFYEGFPTWFIAQVNLDPHIKIAWLHTSTELSQKGKTLIELKKQENGYQSYDKIVGVSQGVSQSFKALFPSLSAKLNAVYNPIDIEKIVNKAKEPIELTKPSCPLLVSVGRMTAAKGYNRYLRVVRDLVQEGYDFEVWIIGGGDRLDLEHYCKENNLNNVRFLGSRSNPFPYMKQADCIISSSYIEGLSTVVIEGLALGKCVIATDCNGTAEIIGKKSEYGILVDNSQEGLYEGIKRFLTDNSLKGIYEQKAIERSHYFDVKNSISKIESLFNSNKC